MAEPQAAPGRELDEEGIRALAGALAAELRPPLVIHLEGELGAGKTTFARALIQALGYPGRVKSPTYGLLEHYSLDDVEVLHLDLYRLAEKGELEFLGIPDLIDSNTLLLVEWPERGGRHLPTADALIRLSGEGDSRLLSYEAHSNSGKNLCKSIRNYFK